MERGQGQATGEEGTATKLRRELGQLKAYVEDLQSLCADVDSLKAMIASIHAALISLRELRGFTEGGRTSCAALTEGLA